MTDDRLSGLALIAGSAGVIVTLSLHPSGRELFAPGQFESAARKLIAVHSLALASLPLWFLGACGLSRRLSAPVNSGSVDASSPDPNPNRQLGIAGLAMYGFALTAMMTAVVIDGLVSPGLAREIVNATGTVGQEWRIAFNYNGMLDEAFVRVFMVGSSVAIGLWSVSIIRSTTLARALGIYGCLLGTATLIALFSGQLDRHAHLFGLVIVGQAAWFTVAGALLYRLRSA